MKGANICFYLSETEAMLFDLISNYHELCDLPCSQNASLIPSIGPTRVYLSLAFFMNVVHSVLGLQIVEVTSTLTSKQSHL